MTDRSMNLFTPAETVVQWPETVISNTETGNDPGPPFVQLIQAHTTRPVPDLQ